MNFKKILLSGVAALALTSTAAFAAGDSDNTTNDVVVAADQTGDYLVFPSFFANTAGWETNFKVVNTDTVNAVVAKVIVRESANSTEILDFPIFLSPGDVFEGKLVQKADGLYFQSSDDSVYNDIATKFANEAAIDKKTPISATAGYIEVHGIAQEAAVALSGSWLEGKPLSKQTIFDKYVAQVHDQVAVAGTWIGVGNDAIYGQAVISAANSNGNLAMTQMAVAFENVTGALANNQLLIGQTGVLDHVTNNDESSTIQDIEDAIVKSNVYVTYYENAANTAMAETSLLLTDPTKKYDATALTDGYDATTATTKTYYEFLPKVRDNSENLKTNIWSGSTNPRCETEVCQVDVSTYVGTTYTKGYVDFDLTTGTIGTAVPVIPAVMTAKSVGGTNVTNIIYPAFN